MEILLIRTTGIRGTVYEAGVVADVDTDSARALIAMGKAVANEEEPEPSEPKNKPVVASPSAAKPKKGRNT